MTKPSKKPHRVVVTGLGVVSSIGIGWQEFWKNLLAGKSGISRIESFDTSKYDRHYAGEIKNFDPTQFIPKRKVPLMGRSSQFAIAASKLALRDGGIKVAELRGKRAGVCIGTTMGEPRVMEDLDAKCFPDGQYNVDFVSAFAYPASSIAANVANQLKLTAQNTVFSNACAAGNYAIGRAFDLIRSGRADFMLAGGADAFSRIAYTGFARLYAIAPEKCQPFDKNRKGMIPGEGAGMLLLESLDSARKRKAPVYAEILGYSLSCDAQHMTNPKQRGIEKAVRKILMRARIDERQVDYISAHGTGTVENDRTECEAFKAVFGRRLKSIPVSSIKSMLGHTMGAAAALESVACCLVLKDNHLPPTINYEAQDAECPVDCVPNSSRGHVVRYVLNNSQAFGGNNAILIFSRNNGNE